MIILYGDEDAFFNFICGSCKNDELFVIRKVVCYYLERAIDGEFSMMWESLSLYAVGVAKPHAFAFKNHSQTIFVLFLITARCYFCMRVRVSGRPHTVSSRYFENREHDFIRLSRLIHIFWPHTTQQHPRLWPINCNFFQCQCSYCGCRKCSLSGLAYANIPAG